MEVEERRFTPRPVELRAAPEGSRSPGVLTGYAVVFDSLSRDLGGWFEEIDPGAFGAAAAGGALDLARHHRVIARFNHNSDATLGTTNAGTLRVFVDETGVWYETDLPDTSAGRDVAVLAERGDLSFSSFSFSLLPDGVTWREDGEGRLVRRVMSATMHDVAPVIDPAYFGSSAGMQRSLDLDAIRASLHSPSGPDGRLDSVRALRARAESAATPYSRRGGRKK